MARISEICNLRINDIDLKNNSLKVKGKGSKERHIPLDSETVTILSEFISNRLIEIDEQDKNPSLFVNIRGKPIKPRTIQRDLKRFKENLGYTSEKKLTPHIFRHTGATHLRQNGMDLSELQDLLGHSSPNTTRIYAKNDLTRLTKSYRIFHPLSVKGKNQ